MLKYKLTNETIKVDGRILYRIEALKDFGPIRKGEKGGYSFDKLVNNDKANESLYKKYLAFVS